MKLFAILKITHLLATLTLLNTFNYNINAQSNDHENLVNEAMRLVNSPNPVFESLNNNPLDSATISNMGFEQVYENQSHSLIVRDRKKLFAYKYEKEESNVTVLLVHGVLSNGYLMNKTAGLLSEKINAEVYAIDLRGHGRSDGNPGDVDYIDQYADDLEDVIKIIKSEKPKNKIILVGHSMGGGISLKYSLLKNSLLIDAYILLAPLLSVDSPTISKKEKGSDEDKFIDIHINRIIGLKMLNSIGNHKYDNLPVLFFNLPEGMPLRSYSYRANESMTPENYIEGLASVNKPLLVLAGSNDEAFAASEFDSVVKNNSDGDVFLIEGENHNSIRHSIKCMNIITEWVNKNQLVN